MRRSLLTIFLVACLSSLISHFQCAQGSSDARGEWIRTVDGWEPRRVLEAGRDEPLPEIHPALAATFELGASMFVLLAFPARVRAVEPLSPPALAGQRRRRRTTAASTIG